MRASSGGRRAGLHLGRRVPETPETAPMAAETAPATAPTATTHAANTTSATPAAAALTTARAVATGRRPPLSPTALVQLQRTAGNAAATLAVQRYKPLGAGAATLPAANEQHGREMFESHLAEPTATSLEAPLSWGNVTTSNPNLLASDDDTVVIQDTAKEPQDFYATPAVVAHAQAVLARHDSLIALAPGASTIDVAGHTLRQVKARSNMVPLTTRIAGEVESLLDHICINMANVVLGLHQTARSHEVVLHHAGHGSSRDRRVPITSDGLKSGQVESLAATLAGASGASGASGGAGPGTVHKKAAAPAMAAPGPVPADTGERYGRALGAGNLARAGKRLGVNEHAAPAVGEAYATYSVKTADGAHLDYSAMAAGAPTARAAIWGYHFAGVVAESEDGADKVTLENYNRQGDIYDAFVDKLIHDFGNGIEDRAKAAAGSNSPARDLSDLYAELRGGSEKERAAAKKKLVDALRQSFDDALKAWFFRMYGTRAGSGQTFHEKSAASGYFANPLTVRVAAPAATTYDQATTRRFGLLTKVAYQCPLDYRENENVVRPAAKAYQERVALADHVKAARDEEDARSRLVEGLAILADGQALAHFDHVAGRARRLGVPASAVPALPRDAAAYLDAFTRFERAFAARADRRLVGKERKADLTDAASTAAAIREAVAGQQAYYARYLAPA